MSEYAQIRYEAFTVICERRIRLAAGILQNPQTLTHDAEAVAEKAREIDNIIAAQAAGDVPAEP